jgi:hypothetical protein
MKSTVGPVCSVSYPSLSITSLQSLPAQRHKAKGHNVEVEVEVNLRPTICRLVCLGVGLLSVTYDKIFLFCLTIVGFLM